MFAQTHNKASTSHESQRYKARYLCRFIRIIVHTGMFIVRTNNPKKQGTQKKIIKLDKRTSHSSIIYKSL